MFDLKYFFEQNHIDYNGRNKRIKYEKNGIVWIDCRSEDFGGKEVKALLGKINYVMKKYGKMCRELYLEFDHVRPKDKLSYIILECIVYELLQKYKKVIVVARCVIPGIHTSGINYSPLIKYMRRTISADQYCRYFSNDLGKRYFRRTINKDDKMAVSILMTDIKSFFKFFNLEKEDGNKIARIVSELADNACEHAESDCLIDIDVSEDYRKNNDPDGIYYSVNICVLNFSKIFLGDTLREKIHKQRYGSASRYITLAKAYETHKNFFDSEYTEEHFFMLSTFQDEISGRDNVTETGGTGLYEMIREVEKRVDTHHCYVLSKDKVIGFWPEFLLSNSQGWIGFNKQSDFLNERPDEKILTDSDTFLTGTGYNLTLIYRGRNE